MSDVAALEQRIGELLRDQLHLAVPTPDTDLFESAALDSLSLVELLVQLEKEFELKIPLEQLELDNFRTIVRIARFVSSRLGGAPVAEATREYPRLVSVDCSVKHG